MNTNRNRPELGENKMRTMPLGKLIFTMALPLILSMLVQAFYNVVDIIACIVAGTPYVKIQRFREDF